MEEINKIWLSSPHMGGTEEKYVKDAFDSNWLAPIGPNIDKFETAISKSLSSKITHHTAVVNSGTAALHLALRMLNLEIGDVVMVQSLTFCGTANPVAYQGAEIVFIDSEPDTWNMCSKCLSQAMEDHRHKKIKAIIPVHLYGMPAKINQIQTVADRYDVPVIEDAAEALGSSFNGQACGTFGLMSILSFNGNKIITTSSGGALVSRHKEYIDRARFLATQARDDAPHYQHSEIGYNYRMSNILAGVGIGQMEVLDQRVNQRRLNNKRYRDFFKDIPGITLQTEPSNKYHSNYWLTAILIKPSLTDGIDREKVRLALSAENIESRPIWKPMHMQPVYNGAKFYGTGVCEKLFEQGLCLPSGSNLTQKEFDRIFKVLEKIFN